MIFKILKIDNLMVCFVLMMGLGCSDNEVLLDETPMPKANSAPEAFDLIEVQNDVVVFNLKEVTFSWEPSIDPDGDTVTYDVYLGTDPTDVSLLFGSVASPKYDFSGRFDVNKFYYWKVIAKDGNGGETESTSTFRFDTRSINIPTAPLVTQACFPIRFSHAATVHDQRLWVIGGATRNGVTNNLVPYNDVWYSTDGLQWEEVTKNAGFSPRSSHAVVAFNEKLWVIGGNDGQLKNDVWTSVDGWNWTKVLENAAFPPMAEHKAVVFKDKIWVFYDDEIWNSTDGVTWSKVNLKVPFTKRTRYGVSVMNERLWVAGGYVNVDDYKSDLWYSDDGETWMKNDVDPVSTPRFDVGTVSFDGTTYLFGGRTGQFLQLSDEIWHFSFGFNGFTYLLEPLGAYRNADTSYVKRVWATYTAFDNKVFMIGGTTSDFDGLGLNDVWVFD